MSHGPHSSQYGFRDVVAENIRAMRFELESFGIVHVSLFGSVARGQATADSDVDIILEDKPERRIDLFDLVDIRKLMERRLRRSVDIGTRASLRPGRRDAILAELYEVF